jgi:hypothetical protein
VNVPNRFVEIGCDLADSMYLDFHSKDSALPDYSTRIISQGGTTTGTGNLNMYASTIGMMCSAGVGIGTTAPQYMLDVSDTTRVSGVIPAVGQPDSTTLQSCSYATFGQTWTLIGGLPPVTGWNGCAISATGQYMTICVYGGSIYYSSNYGSTWFIATGYPANANYQSIGMSATGQYQIATVNSLSTGVYVSSNYGATWSTSYNTGSSASGRYSCFSSNGQYQFVALNSTGSVIISSNYGSAFTPTSAPSGDYVGICCSSSGQYVSACTYVGGNVYYSSNYGTSWNAVSIVANLYSMCCSTSGQYQMVTVINGSIYYSSNYGATWTVSNAPSASWRGIACTASGQYAMAVVNAAYIYYSTNYGVSWTLSNSPATSWNQPVISQNGLYTLSVAGTGVYLSTLSNVGLVTNGRIGIGTTAPQYMLDVSGTAQVNGVVTLTQGQPDSTILPNPFDVIGQTWTALSGLSTSAAWYRSAISATGQYMTVCINGAASGNNIYYSSNYGATWTLATGFLTNAAYYGLGMSPTGQYQLATIDTSGSVLYASSNYGATWSTVGYTLTNATGRHVCFSSTGQYQFVATNGAGGKIVISSNYGTSFANTAAITANWSSVCCSSNGAYVSACPFGSTIYYSTNTGTSWTASASLSANWTGICCSSTGQYQIAVVYSGNIYYSSNYGVNWTLSNSVSAVWVSVSCTSSGQYATAVTFGGYIYYSTNFGQTWAQSGSASANWQCVTMSQNGLYSLACVATSGAVYLSVATPATATIVSNGRIGIGTTTPANQLQIYSTVPNGSFLSIYGNGGAGNTAGIYMSPWGGTLRPGGTTTGIWGLDDGNFSANLIFATAPGGSSSTTITERMRITSSGNVGIGTTAPGSFLTIYDNATAAYSYPLTMMAPNLTAGGDQYILFGKSASSANQVQFGFHYVGIGSTSNYAFIQNYGISNCMCWTAGGNVGIGITNPSATLHVNGTLSVSSAINSMNSSITVTTSGVSLYTLTSGQSGWLFLRWSNGHSLHFFQWYSGINSQSITQIINSANANTITATLPSTTITLYSNTTIGVYYTITFMT